MPRCTADRVGRAPGAAGKRHHGVVERVGERRHRGVGARADDLGDRERAGDDLAGDAACRPAACALLQAQLDRVDAERRPRACPSAPRARSRSAPRRSRASRRTAGCWCARPSPRAGRVRHPVRTGGEAGGVGQHGRRRRGVRATVEHDAGLDLDEGAVGLGVVADTTCGPGGGARDRRTTPRGCRPSSPVGRCAGPAGTSGSAG